MLRGLSDERTFTVFSIEFENPYPDRITWVRIPAPIRPAILTLIVYHLLAPFYYFFHLLKTRKRFDLIQVVTPIFPFGQIAYSHFCNRSYLKHHWAEGRPTGLRRLLRWMDHKALALLEPFMFRKFGQVVVPCQGLARELKHEYPYVQDKLHIIANPVDTARMVPPPDFDRRPLRQELGVKEHDTLLVFTALGHFERKGLPLVLNALTLLNRPDVKLVVVGGEADVVAQYTARVRRMGLGSQVTLVGKKKDPRPYLWSGDAFAFPSLYEAFSLSSLEAAAAGLPLIVAPINGIEEFLKPDENGFMVGRTAESVAEGILKFINLTPAQKLTMGELMRKDVQKFSTESFVESWRELYKQQNAS